MDNHKYGWARNIGQQNSESLFGFDVKQPFHMPPSGIASIPVGEPKSMIWEQTLDECKSPTFLNLIEELQRASAVPDNVNVTICNENTNPPQRASSFARGSRRHTFSSIHSSQPERSKGSNWLKTHSRTSTVPQPASPYGSYISRHDNVQMMLSMNNVSSQDSVADIMDFLEPTEKNVPVHSFAHGMPSLNSANSLNSVNSFNHRPLTQLGRRATYNGRYPSSTDLETMDQGSEGVHAREHTDEAYSVQQMYGAASNDSNIIPPDLMYALSRQPPDVQMTSDHKFSLQDEFCGGGYSYQSPACQSLFNNNGGDLNSQTENISPTQSADSIGGKKKCRRRRTFAELSREFTCNYPDCNRPYASAHSLQQHIRIKHTLTHPTLFKSEKKKSKSDSGMAEEDEDEASAKDDTLMSEPDMTEENPTSSDTKKKHVLSNALFHAIHPTRGKKKTNITTSSGVSNGSDTALTA